MLCAKELNILQKAYEENERAKKRALDKQAELDHDTAKRAAIVYCEDEINKMLIAAARQGKHSISITVAQSTDRLHNTHFKIVKMGWHRYANGAPSYDVTGSEMDWSTFCGYLKQHCLTIETWPTTYKCYGLGELPATKVYIDIPKDEIC